MLNNKKIKTANVTGEIKLSDMDCMLKVKPDVIVTMKCCIDVQILVAVLATVLSFSSIKTVMNKCHAWFHVRHFDPTHYSGAFPAVGLNAMRIFLYSRSFQIENGSPEIGDKNSECNEGTTDDKPVVAEDAEKIRPKSKSAALKGKK
jgi:hypothetical protein